MCALTLLATFRILIFTVRGETWCSLLRFRAGEAFVFWSLTWSDTSEHPLTFDEFLKMLKMCFAPWPHDEVLIDFSGLVGFAGWDSFSWLTSGSCIDHNPQVRHETSEPSCGDCRVACNAVCLGIARTKM